MISETRLQKEMTNSLDNFIEHCSPLEGLKADGYMACYNDVMKIIGEMVEENRIKSHVRRQVKKFLR